MFALNVTLHLLDILSAALRLFWLIVALVEIFSKRSAPLYARTSCALKKLSKSKAPSAHPTLMTITEPDPPSPVILYKPLFSLHTLVYTTLAPQLTHLPPEHRLFLLSGRRFAALADSIIGNTPLPIVKQLGLKLPLHEEVEQLKRLPEVMVTPPDDGDRLPLPGEMGAKKVRYRKGLLAPPQKRSRLGKLLKEREKALAATEKRKKLKLKREAAVD